MHGMQVATVNWQPTRCASSGREDERQGLGSLSLHHLSLSLSLARARARSLSLSLSRARSLSTSACNRRTVRNGVYS